MKKKYQIFVSSTYIDLVEERNEIIKAILDEEHIPVGMEMFPATNDSQWELITRIIDECDYYVVVVAHRYGSIVDGEEISYTEKEYDYAISKNVPILGFIIKDSESWPNNKIQSEKVTELKTFKDKIKKKVIKEWCNKDQLASLFKTSLNKIINENPRTGWVRTNILDDAKKEIERLKEQNNGYGQISSSLQEDVKLPEVIHAQIQDSLHRLRYKTAQIQMHYPHPQGIPGGFSSKLTTFKNYAHFFWYFFSNKANMGQTFFLKFIHTEFENYMKTIDDSIQEIPIDYVKDSYDEKNPTKKLNGILDFYWEENLIFHFPNVNQGDTWRITTHGYFVWCELNKEYNKSQP